MIHGLVCRCEHKIVGVLQIFIHMYITVHHEDSFAQVKGDGGCFPRALSLNLFGTEDLFAHIPLFVLQVLLCLEKLTSVGLAI